MFYLARHWTFARFRISSSLGRAVLAKFTSHIYIVKPAQTRAPTLLYIPGLTYTHQLISTQTHACLSTHSQLLSTYTKPYLCLSFRFTDAPNALLIYPCALALHFAFIKSPFVAWLIHLPQILASTFTHWSHLVVQPSALVQSYLHRRKLQCRWAEESCWTSWMKPQESNEIKTAEVVWGGWISESSWCLIGRRCVCGQVLCGCDVWRRPGVVI